jgi:endoglucanase
MAVSLLSFCLLPPSLYSFPLEIVQRSEIVDQFQLNWRSQTGKSYAIQSTTNLKEGFSDFAPGQQAVSPENTWWVDKSEVEPVRFFRVREIVPDLGYSERRAAHELNRRLNRGNNFMAAKAINGQGAPEDYQLMRESGFNHVRIGYKLDEFVSSADNYLIPLNHLREIQRLVDACLAEGLIAIIDPVHNWANGPGYTDNEADRTKLGRIWQQVAAWFADYDLENVVFEIMNEPHDNAARDDVDNVAKIIEIGLAAIRGEPGNETRIVIVSGDGFSTRQALIDSLDNGDIPGDDPYLVGTFHYYDPRPFTKQGEDGTTLNWGTISEFEETISKFDEVVAANNRFATRNNTEPLPIYLGEFGVDNAAPEADRTRWLSWIRMQAEVRGFSWAHWNMYNNSGSSKGMGPWTSTEKDDPTTRRFDPAPLEALVGFYEFEDGSKGGGVIVSTDEPGYSGGGYAAFPQATGVAVWARADSIYIPKTDTYVAKIHYASAVDRTVRLVTGAQTLTHVLFPGTGRDDSWATLEVEVQFNASSGHDSDTESLKIVADPDPGPQVDWVHITCP